MEHAMMQTMMTAEQAIKLEWDDSEASGQVITTKLICCPCLSINIDALHAKAPQGCAIHASACVQIARAKPGLPHSLIPSLPPLVHPANDKPAQTNLA